MNIWLTYFVRGLCSLQKIRRALCLIAHGFLTFLSDWLWYWCLYVRHIAYSHCPKCLSRAYLLRHALAYKVDIPIFFIIEQFRLSGYKSDTAMIFASLEIDITTFNQEKSLFIPTFEITIIFQRQDHLPMHIHNIGWLISHNGETKIWVQSMSLSRNPNPCSLSLFSPSAKCDGYIFDYSWLLTSCWKMTATSMELHGFGGLYILRWGLVIGNDFVCHATQMYVSN